MSIFSFTSDKAAKFLLYSGLPSLAIYGYLHVYLVCCSVWQPWAATWQLSSGCRTPAKHCYTLQRAAQRFCSALQLNFSCKKTSKTLQISCKSAVQPFRSAFVALHSAARFVRAEPGLRNVIYLVTPLPAGKTQLMEHDTPWRKAVFR